MIAGLQMRLYIALHLQPFFYSLVSSNLWFSDMYLQQNTYISVLRKTQNYDTFVH